MLVLPQTGVSDCVHSVRVAGVIQIEQQHVVLQSSATPRDCATHGHVTYTATYYSKVGLACQLVLLQYNEIERQLLSGMRQIMLFLTFKLRMFPN